MRRSGQLDDSCKFIILFGCTLLFVRLTLRRQSEAKDFFWIASKELFILLKCSHTPAVILTPRQVDCQARCVCNCLLLCPGLKYVKIKACEEVLIQHRDKASFKTAVPFSPCIYFPPPAEMNWRAFLLFYGNRWAANDRMHSVKSEMIYVDVLGEAEIPLCGRILRLLRCPFEQDKDDRSGSTCTDLWRLWFIMRRCSARLHKNWCFMQSCTTD